MTNIMEKKKRQKQKQREKSWEETSDKIPHPHWTGEHLGSDLFDLGVSSGNSVGWDGFKNAPTTPRDAYVKMYLLSRM